jgi:predicted GNAT family acetyltransferase
MDLEIADNPQEHRFEVRVDGEVMGFAAYRLRPGLIAFTHTHIDPRLEGKGAGSRLARVALDESRARGLAVMPFCPFINWWIKQHPEYADLVPPQFHEHFGLVGSPAGSPS